MKEIFLKSEVVFRVLIIEGRFAEDFLNQKLKL